jgi:protein-L-isoaspartate(D-aspartate) O-methyltransferase
MARGTTNLTHGGRRRRDVAMLLLGPLVLAILAAAVSGCPAGKSGSDNASNSRTAQNARAPEPEAPASREHPAFGQMVQQRAEMVRWQIAARHITDPNVLHAMRTVPRHAFVPAEDQPYAYADHPLPIGQGQTISQPYIVAFMTEALKLNRKSVVLEIGTGSGYQAAVAAEIAKEVYTIEIVEPLAKSAAELLKELGYTNVHVRAGDGYRGWPEKAPFDAIIGTAAAGHIPPALMDQLKSGGRMVLPVADELGFQYLILLTKNGRGELHQEKLMPVLFVPMTGEIQRSERRND